MGLCAIAHPKLSYDLWRCVELLITVILQEALKATITAYNLAAMSAGSDELGKKVFPNKVEIEGPFYAAIVMPVVHYTMGGVKIDGQARALDINGRPITGLYAAGEVSGG